MIVGILAASLIVVHPLPHRAPDPGAEWCEPSVVYNENPSPNATDAVDRIHPLLSRIRWADEVHNEQWELALRGLRDEAASAFVDAGVGNSEQQRFFAELDATIAATSALPRRSDGGWANYLTTSVQPIRFHPIHLVNAYQLFRSSPIDLSALARGSARQVQALCWSAFSVNQVLARLALGLQAATLARLGRLNMSWANYRAYGYTRQALEQIAFRGRATVHDTLPGRVQWLLGHLSVGEEVQWRDSTTTATSTVIEVVGGLRYWHDYTQYSGASVIATLPTSGRPGFGGMVHFARSIRAGAVVRRSDRKWRPGIVMSADVYGFLDRSKHVVDRAIASVNGRVLLGDPSER
ncbi:MAG TPA: hypothetical protein VJW73_17740 [Gemmatimonadaceae bacterium]|nr:hypothetical protein [Gemmatimonadaceae bacterium]